MGKLLKRLVVYSFVVVAIIVTTFFLLVQARLAIVNYRFPYPQAILVLGGGRDREPIAAQLAARQPNLQIWISNGVSPSQANKIFLAEDVSLNRLNLDYKATDTVTNFTTLVTVLKTQGIQHVYLVTSDFHMRRSKAIAFWVLGSHGIAYTPVPVFSKQSSEPLHKIWRDVVRSWLWLLTGRTGSSLDPTPPVKSF